VAVVVALSGFVLVAGTWRLDAASLWNDEAATWAISGHGLSDLLRELGSSGGDRAAALYYVVVHFWSQAFGTSEIALRSLSVVAGAATIAPLYAVGRRLIGRAAAAVGTALFAASPFFLLHTREARTYALSTLLVVVATWAFVVAVQSGRRRSWFVYTLVASLAVYTHWFAALVVAAHYASLGWPRADPSTRRAASRSLFVFAILISPIIVAALLGNDESIAWIAPLSLGEVDAFVGNFVGTTSRFDQVVVLVLLALGVLTVIQRITRSRTTGRTTLGMLVVLWCLLPVVATIAVSTVKPVLVARYLIVALPAFALLVGAGVTRITRARIVPTVAAFAALVLLGSGGYAALWGDAHGEDWRSVARTVDAAIEPGDAVIVFPASAVFVLGYYARTQPRLAQHPGPQWPPVSWNAPFSRGTPNASVLDTIARAPSRVVWLVVRAPSGSVVRQDVVGKPVLQTLERLLALRYARKVPWTSPNDKTVYVIRYSNPTVP
jgi:mannosyltransferase